MLESMQPLDAAVAVARQYVGRHPDTLLVVTGDHDCGGLSVEDTGSSDESGDGISAEDGPFDVAGSDEQFDLDWTTSGHTDTPVPVTAVGPGADRFSGQHPNTFRPTPEGAQPPWRERSRGFSFGRAAGRGTARSRSPSPWRPRPVCRSRPRAHPRPRRQGRGR